MRKQKNMFHKLLFVVNNMLRTHYHTHAITIKSLSVESAGTQHHEAFMYYYSCVSSI